MSNEMRTTYKFIFTFFLKIHDFNQYGEMFKTQYKCFHYQKISKPQSFLTRLFQHIFDFLMKIKPFEKSIDEENADTKRKN